MKKALVSLVVLSMVMSMFAGCGSGSSSASTGGAPSSPTAAAETPEGKGITTIRFYGSDSEYNQNMVAGFQAENPDIKVEIVPVDFNNAEQVIKTGIASNDPVDVSFFWGTIINAFSDVDMALDLTPYLTENNNEWLNTFVPTYIEGSNFGGKYYAIPYQPVIETIFYNKDLFKENGIEPPKTWEELMVACETFKQKGVFGFGGWAQQSHQFLQFAYQYMANDGTLKAYTNGEGDFTKCEGLRKFLTDWKSVYDNGYLYPGEGALTSTRDQTQAAWYQGKIAMLFDAGSSSGDYQKNCEFEVGILPFPYVQEGGKYALNTVTNALFIPANAKHPEEAIRFIKYYTSDAGIQQIINSGRLPSTISMQGKVESPLLKDLLATGVGENVVGYRQLQGLSSEINAYIQNDLISAICSGTSVDDALQNLEDLRQSTILKK